MLAWFALDQIRAVFIEVHGFEHLDIDALDIDGQIVDLPVGVALEQRIDMQVCDRYRLDCGIFPEGFNMRLVEPGQLGDCALVECDGCIVTAADCCLDHLVVGPRGLELLG